MLEATKYSLLCAAVSLVTSQSASAANPLSEILVKEFWELCLTSGGRNDWTASRAEKTGYKPSAGLRELGLDRFKKAQVLSKSFDEGTVTIETFFLSNDHEFTTVCQTSMSSNAERVYTARSFVKEIASLVHYPQGGDLSMIDLETGTETWILGDEPFHSISLRTVETDEQHQVAIAYVNQKLRK